MKQVVRKGAILFLPLAMTLGNAHAVEIQDVSKAPVSYATQKGDKIVFNGTGGVWRPSELNMILNAYGLQLNPDTFQKIADYATVKEVQQGGQTTKVINYGTTPTAWHPSKLNEIFNAYGVSIDQSRMENVPKIFATVKDGNVVFSSGGYAWRPATLDAILSAYQ
jgi:hypothetical protein